MVTLTVTVSVYIVNGLMLSNRPTVSITIEKDYFMFSSIPLHFFYVIVPFEFPFQKKQRQK